MVDTVASVRGRCRFPADGSAVTCAVSGGADSLALLVLAVDAGLSVTAVHVDHGLRPGSATEAAVVEAAAARFGASFRAERVTVEPGADLEARARRARHGVLPDDALFGHTLDDQAETVLLALMRGAGLDGLRGMGADGHPLLEVRRSETEAICAELDLAPVRDPTNDDPRHRRNRVRHELLPLMDDIAQRDCAPLLARTASIVAADGDHLDVLARGIDPTDAPAIASLPDAIGARVVRRWLRTYDDEAHPPDAAAVSRVLAVARGDAVAAQVSGGIEVRRSGQRLEAGPVTGRG